MEDSIKVYSLPTCGMCKLLKRELDSRSIKYEVCEDVQEMESKGISNVPMMEVDGELLNFQNAMKYLKEESK